jgi:hypothetical protein
MSKKPKGFGKFDKLMKKLVKVPPTEIPPPQKCRVPGCRNLADDPAVPVDGWSAGDDGLCRGCRKHFGELMQDE